MSTGKHLSRYAPNSSTPMKERQINREFLPEELSRLLTKPIGYHRIYAEICDDVLAGVMLSQGVHWSNHTTEDDGSFYKTQEEWFEETALTRRNQEAARKTLRGLKDAEGNPCWIEKLKGVPAKLYYRIDHKALTRLMIEKAANPKVFPKYPSKVGVTEQTVDSKGQSQIGVVSPAGLAQDAQQEGLGSPTYLHENTHEITSPDIVNFPKAENLLVASSEIPSQEIVEPSLENSSNVDSQEKPAAQPKAKAARKPQVDSREDKASTPAPKTQGSPVSTSPTDHQVMMAALATTTNQPILNGAAQGKAIKTILNHYTADQGIEVLHWMADPKTNWRGRVDWLAVQSFIPEYFRRKAQQQPQEIKPNGFSTKTRDFSRIIANLPEHLR